jgi:plastocyanin
VKRWLLVGLVLALVLAFASPAAAAEADGPRTYTIDVGFEDSHAGITLMAFFPNILQIHAGDSVHFRVRSFEIHTVTFPAGKDLSTLAPFVPAPPGLASPLMLNPIIATPVAPAGGQYDGSTFVNSGVMGLAPGQVHDFSLTFTKTGKFDFVCLIHGPIQSGEITVVDQDQPVPSPSAARLQGFRQLARLLAQVPGALEQANDLVPKPERHPDGTTTYHVVMGFEPGQIGLMRFFPSDLKVRPNDSVQFQYAMPGAPHTVTFLNGATAPDVIVPTPNNGQILALLNPRVLFPNQAGKTLTRQGVFSSGLLLPAGSGTPFPSTFSVKIGDIRGRIDYVCLIHDDSGMKATLEVAAGGR